MKNRFSGAPVSCVLALLAGLIGGPVLADGPSSQSPSVETFYGAFSTSEPISVPSFHGLEPSLRLAYSSTGASGLAGVGWGLQGFSTIERVSPGKGVPRYDGGDLFLLDGQDLMACPPGSASPSCTTGGTHATRIESYQRITYDAGANTWTVWRKDGTRLAYAPLFPVYRNGGYLGTYRWGLSSVTDTSGNVVHYGWWCDGSPVQDCYPDSVSYNGFKVTLYREARPDPISFANGSGSLGTTRYRLKSVLVTAPGQVPLRAYKLMYTSSGGSSRSLLASIQQYGRDVVIDGVGHITGGSALPAITLGWSGSAASKQLQYTGTSGTSTETYWASVVDSAPHHGKVFSLDVNGDGRGDMVMVYQDANNRSTVAHHWVSDGGKLQYTGTSGTGETYWASVIDSSSYRGRAFPMDVNGDGKGDLVMVYQDVHNRVTAVHHWVSDGGKLQYTGTSGTSTETYWSNVIDSSTYHGKAFPMDVNGDGKEARRNKLVDPVFFKSPSLEG